MKISREKFIKIIFTILIILIIIFINKITSFSLYTPSEIKEYLNSYEVNAPIIYIILFTLVPLTLFPDSILVIGAGMVFGLLKGFIYTMIGALCGATLSFFIARFLGRSIVNKLTNSKVSKINQYFENNGFLVILILRLIPLFPFDLISYSAGLSNVKYREFLFATIIGTIPGILVYTNLGDKFIDVGSSQFYLSITLLLLLFVISYFFKDKVRTFTSKKL